MFTLIVSLLAIGAFCILAADAAPPGGGPGSQRGALGADSMTYDWLDAERNRPVPAKVYYPRIGNGPFPVIIFSHGLGGSRDGYDYLGRWWASNGYVSVHVQHKGSDTGIWQDGEVSASAMLQAVADPRNAIDRPLDVRFAIDQMERLNTYPGSPLRARLDLKRIGVAGHSYGALTALVVAGRLLIDPEGKKWDLRDRRVEACISMSSPSKDASAARKEYETFAVPCLHMTGTKDESPIGIVTVAQRRVPFDCIDKADQYLIIFTGGDHMVFSGRPRPLGAGDSDRTIHDLVMASSTIFWDAYLKADKQAREFLTRGWLEKILGENGTFEKKLRPRE